MEVAISCWKCNIQLTITVEVEKITVFRAKKITVEVEKMTVEVFRAKNITVELEKMTVDFS